MTINQFRRTDRRGGILEEKKNKKQKTKNKQKNKQKIKQSTFPLLVSNLAPHPFIFLRKNRQKSGSCRGFGVCDSTSAVMQNVGYW